MADYDAGGGAQALEPFRRLACLYARAMDRGEPELLDQILTADVVLEGPGFRCDGLAEARRNPDMLREMYLLTRHVVENQTIAVEGDRARGETYSTASHVLRPGPEHKGCKALIWAIRYQDEFRREGGAWRFSHRTLVLDWSELRDVAPQSPTGAAA